MNKINFNEVLDRTYNSNLPHVKQKVLWISMDIGSTETRSITYSPEVKEQQTAYLTEVFKTPSQTWVADTNIPVDGESMKDRLVCRFSSGQIAGVCAKGTITDSLVSKARTINSSSDKLLQRATYSSIFFDIALICELDSQVTGVKADHYIIKLMLSIPPKESNNKKNRENQEKFFNQGGIVYYFPFFEDNGGSFSIQSCNLLQEPEAAGIYFKAIHNLIDARSNYLFLDVGGRSAGVVPMKSGRLLGSNTTIDKTIGGSKLLANIAEEVAIKYSISVPSTDLICNALQTGEFYIPSRGTDCGQDSDFKEIVDHNKRKFAETIAQYCSDSAAINGIDFGYLNGIYLTGRVFNDYLDSRTGQPYYVSLFELVKETLRDDYGYEGAIRCENNDYNLNPICNGLFYAQAAINAGKDEKK